MTATPRLALPLMVASQAAKHVTFNELARALDLATQTVLQSRTTAQPPAGAPDGQSFLVPAGAGGEWSGQAGLIATRTDGTWQFWAAPEGTVAWVTDELLTVRRIGPAWLASTAVSEEQACRRLGINTAATVAERLRVASSVVVFNFDDTPGHSGDVRLKLNRAGRLAGASIDFQTAWAGCVEMGLVSDDVFRFKASANGTDWRVAWSVDTLTGWVGIGTDRPAAPLHILRGVTPPVVERIDDSSLGPGFELRKARGSPAAPAAVLAGDVVQSMASAAFDGVSYIPSGNLRWRVEGLDAPGQLRTRIEFVTCSGTAGSVERLRVTSDGKVGIGTLTPTTRLDVAGPVRLGQFTVPTLPSPSAAGAGAVVFLDGAASGPTLAFSDGTSWRNVRDGTAILP